MRASLLLALAAACSSDEAARSADVLLSVDVELSPTALSLYASEPERPCDCSVGWTDLGECREQSDAIGCACDPWPASCLEEISLLAGGEPLASARWDAHWWGAFLAVDTAAADELLIAGCGRSVAVAIPERVLPEVSLALDDGGPVPAAVWTTEPEAASAVVSVGNGVVAESCHRPGGSGQVAIPDQGYLVRVTGLAEPVVTDTELGEVRLWYGNSASLSDL